MITDQIAAIALTLSPTAQQALLDYALLLQETDRPEVEPGETPATSGNGNGKARGWVEIKTINGHQYSYRRWREGKTLRSEYVGKVKP